MAEIRYITINVSLTKRLIDKRLKKKMSHSLEWTSESVELVWSVPSVKTRLPHPVQESDRTCREIKVTVGGRPVLHILDE